KGGGEGWNAGLAEARGAEVRLDEVNLHGGSATHAEDGIVSEVGLLDAAFFEGDLKAHGCGEGVDGASLGLVLCAAHVDAGTNVGGGGDLVDGDLFLGVDGEFDCFGDVAAVGAAEC